MLRWRCGEILLSQLSARCLALLKWTGSLRESTWGCWWLCCRDRPHVRSRIKLDVFVTPVCFSSAHQRACIAWSIKLIVFRLLAQVLRGMRGDTSPSNDCTRRRPTGVVDDPAKQEIGRQMAVRKRGFVDDNMVSVVLEHFHRQAGGVKLRRRPRSPFLEDFLVSGTGCRHNAGSSLSRIDTSTAEFGATAGSNITSTLVTFCRTSISSRGNIYMVVSFDLLSFSPWIVSAMISRFACFESFVNKISMNSKVQSSTSEG